MATNTENLGLKKPGQEDFYNVDDFNENFDKIDEFASRKDNPHGVTAVQTGALPLAGGTITSSVLGLGGGHGSITGCETFTGITGLKDKDTNNNRTLRVINPKYDTYPLKKAVQLVDKIDGTSKEYNLYGEHNKPTADDVGALPNTGGTLNGDLIVSNNNNPSVCCEKTNADGSSAETIVRQYGGYTSFISRNNPSKNKTGDYRSLQLYDPNKLSDDLSAFKLTTLKSGVSNSYSIFGEHNKPSGSYRGNNNTSPNGQTISVGGIGNALLIYSDETTLQNNAYFVTPQGAIFVNNSSVSGLSKANCYFSDGVLFVGSSSGLNHDGKIYKYQVL